MNKFQGNVFQSEHSVTVIHAIHCAQSVAVVIIIKVIHVKHTPGLFS